MVKASLALGIVCHVCAASATKYYFAFGASYIQNGFNIDGVQPSVAHPEGNPAPGSHTFTGGLTLAEFIATKYNESVTYLYDFAVGGAPTDNSIVKTGTKQDFVTQVHDLYNPKYSKPHGPAADWDASDSYYSFLFGINDIYHSVGNSSPDAAIDVRLPKIMKSYFDQLSALYDYGARKMIIFNIPPFDRSPATTSARRDDTIKWIEAYNTALETNVVEWRKQHEHHDVVIYDYHAFMTKVLNAPGTYGFKDAKCAGDVKSTCVWWSGSNLHPTERFDNILAKDVSCVTKLAKC